MIAILAGVQLVNVLDVMMVMPLGPALSGAHAIPSSELGWLSGSYMASAALAGIGSSRFLDRFERKRALIVTLVGLGISTGLGGTATGFGSLLSTRISAGIFGGPATALAFAMVADAVAESRRGRAIAALMSAFAVASVVGVPFALEIARRFDWRFPFFAVSGLAFAVTAAAVVGLPSFRYPLVPTRSAPNAAPASSFFRRSVFLAYLGISASVAAAYLILPNLAAYLEFNRGFPRDRLGALYLYGGVAGFFVMLLSGRLVDRYGATPIAAFGTVLIMAIIYAGFCGAMPGLSAAATFIIFMASMGIRGVATTALCSRVPAPGERARFASLLSAVQQSASAAGAVLSTILLSTESRGAIVGMERVAGASLVFSAIAFAAIATLEKSLKNVQANRA